MHGFVVFQLRDYSGEYKVQLVSCTLTSRQSYTQPVECRPGDLVTFDLPIRFQQVSDPVAARFSLNTQFSLIRKQELWLAESLQKEDIDSSAFAPGKRSYTFCDKNVEILPKTLMP